MRITPITNAAPAGVQLIRIELAEPLQHGRHAEAYLVAPTGAALAYVTATRTIEVYDPLFRGGRTGDRFFALYYADSRRAEIIAADTGDYVLGHNAAVSETMPQGGIVEISDEEYESDLGQMRYHGIKPTTEFAKQYMVAVHNIEAGEDGLFYPPGKLCPVLFTGSTPTRGDGYGPTAGEWYGTKNHPQIATVAATESPLDDCAMMHLALPKSFIVKNVGSDISANSTGALTLYKSTTLGSEASAGFNTIQMHNRSSVTFASGKFGFAEIINGKYYTIPAECA